MAKRYLLEPEVAVALSRGKAIECFLGACEQAGRPGVRHISIRKLDSRVALQIFETQDLRNLGIFDLYEFGPLNSMLESGEADETLEFPSLKACLAFINHQWPSSIERLVNEGVIQDEYAAFVKMQSI